MAAPWWGGVALGALVVILGPGGVALANSTPTYSVSLTHSLSKDRELHCGTTTLDGTAGSFGEQVALVPATVGTWALDGVQWQYGWGRLSARLTLPAGATLVGGRLWGSLLLDTGVRGPVLVGFEGAPPPPNPDQPYNCTLALGSAISTGSVELAAWEPPVPFTLDGYALAQDMLGYPVGQGEYVLGQAQGPGGVGVTAVRLDGPLSLEAQYAFVPGVPALRQGPGAPADTTVRWTADGNDPRTDYVLQRSAWRPDQGDSSWVPLYQGQDTRLATAGSSPVQTCGQSYRYRVAAAGSDAHSPWATSAYWDENPCAVTLRTKGDQALNVTWPSGRPGASWIVYSCPSANCRQQAAVVAQGSSLVLADLVPNTEYTVWVCGDSTSFGCPVSAAWTDPATPVLSPDNNRVGIAPDTQPLTWQPNGNPQGTTYVLARWSLAADGAAGSQQVLYRGTRASWVAAEVPGGSYRYVVWAVGAQGATSAPSAAVLTQVASPPSLTATGPTTALVRWQQVAGVDQTWVGCEIDGGGTWTTEGVVGSGADALLVGGLEPDTAYRCATEARSTNAGIPWRQDSPAAYTSAEPPVSLDWHATGLTRWQDALNWAADGNPSATVYQLEMRPVDSSAQRGHWSALWQGAGTRWVSTDQICGAAYLYRVRALGRDGVPTGWLAAQPLTNAPCQVRGTAVADDALEVSWTPALPPNMTVADYRVFWSALALPNVIQNSAGGSGGAPVRITGLEPDARYRVWVTASSGWSSDAATIRVWAAPPGPGGLDDVEQDRLRAHWSAGGNASPTQYAVEVDSCDGGCIATTAQTTQLTASLGGLEAGTRYWVRVRARTGSAGPWSNWTALGETITVPAAPRPVAQTGGLGWSPTLGRGYIRLQWAPVPGAAGYRVWLFDGRADEDWDLGPVLEWNSHQALVYPHSGTLYPRLAAGGGASPLFATPGQGLDLADRPTDLYCTLVPLNEEPCGPVPAADYRLAVSAYNASGDSLGGAGCTASSACLDETLPLQTDPEPPSLVGFALNQGAVYTYASRVGFRLEARGGPSGIAAYALSNDGLRWVEAALVGCTVGQVAACPGGLDQSGTWTLAAGPGAKTVWARVESAAGVWSSPTTAAIYVNADTTVPTVNVTLDQGAAWTAHAHVAVAVRVTDPVTRLASLRWQARYSTDGGQNWSAWEAHAGVTEWVSALDLPGGDAGVRAVLVQVQNQDGNLGQGGAEITYLPPLPGLPPAPGGRACRWPWEGALAAAICVTSPVVDVPLSAPAGSVRVRLSLDDVGWSPWQALAPSRQLDLGRVAGLTPVWWQFQGPHGTIHSQPPVLYVYDPDPPRLAVSWVGAASATDPRGVATLQLAATDRAGAVPLRLTVGENGTTLYQGPLQPLLPLHLQGQGYQLVTVTIEDPADQVSSTELGIYVAASA